MAEKNWWDDSPVVGGATQAPAAPAAPVPGAPVSAPAGGDWWSSSPVVGGTASPAAPGAMAAPAPAQSVGEIATKAGDELQRQLALTGRAAVQGALALPGIVSDAATGLVNTGLDKALGEGQGFRFQRVAAAANNLMNAAGVAQPQNATERVVQDAASAVAGAGTAAGAGQALAKTFQGGAAPVIEAIGNGFSAAPGMQAVSGATGAGAAGAVRENGGGAGAQLAAGLAGAVAPTAATFLPAAAVRGAIRGGEAGRQQMVQNIETFENAAGVTPTLGQATGSRAVQAVETGLSNVVGGSGIMVRRGEAQAKALQSSVDELTAALAPNATGADAGAAITKGVNAFKDNVKTVQGRLYSDLDRFIPAETPMSVNRTQEALAALNESIPGAPNISAFFRNARISSIEQAMLKDLDEASKAAVEPGMRAGVGMAQLPGQLPYQAVQKLRSLVGREISDNSLVSDVPRSKWRALYAALSDDLGDAASAAGPQAQQAWTRANTYTRTSLARLEQLESIVNKDAPEKVFRAATTGLAEGGTTINRLMKSLPMENRREVAAAVLQRLGRAKPGQQNEMGDAFSSETFLTNLASMSPAARRALFSSSGFEGLEARVNQMGAMASNRREGAKVFANPSGTARQTALIGWMGSLMTALATGNPVALGAALGAPVAAAGVARTLTSDRFVKALAQPTVLSPGLGPSAVAAAARAPESFNERREANLARLRERSTAAR